MEKNLLAILCSMTITFTTSVAAGTSIEGINASTIYGNHIDGAIIGFTSELDAVVAATSQYNPTSITEDREFMGVILKKEDLYFYTVESGNRGSDKITIKLRIPKRYDIAAIWHTHGAPSSERKYFSEVDTHLANSLNKRFYLSDHTGILKVFTPGDKVLSAYRAKRMGLPNKRGFGKGALVHDEKGEIIQIATRI